MNAPQAPAKTVWTLAIRIFHWLFAFSILAALILATVGEHTALFPYHMLFGIASGVLLVARILIGLIERGNASLLELIRAPLKVADYLKQLVSGSGEREAGHNPIASLTYLAMFALLALTLVTGLYNENEFAEEAHEFFAYSLLATILFHLCGIVFHTWRYRENVATSMIHGRKQGANHRPVPHSALQALSLATLAACALLIGKVFSSFDPQAQTVDLPLLGQTINLGENESDRHEHREGRRHHDDDD